MNKQQGRRKMIDGYLPISLMGCGDDCQADSQSHPSCAPPHEAPRNDVLSDADGAGKWYLAQCKTGQEHIAARHLTQRRLARVFLPREPRNRRWRGRIQTLLSPVFPGYVFMSPAGPYADWRAIRTTRGLIRMVSFGSEAPASVPLPVLDGLRSRCAADGILRPPSDLRPGERVRLLSGAFAEMIATIEAINPNDRIALLLECMGRQTRVLARAESLSRVS
jgi:transcriptional antiterminator RfaH